MVVAKESPGARLCATVYGCGEEAGRGVRSALRQIVIRGGKHSLKPERAS